MLRQYLNSTLHYMIQTQAFRPNAALQTWSKCRHNVALKTQNLAKLLNFVFPRGHFPTPYLASSQPSPDGRAGTAYLETFSAVDFAPTPAAQDKY